MVPRTAAIVQARASLLSQQDYEGVKKSMPTSIAAAVEQGLPMVVLAKSVDVKAYIEFELVHLAMTVNIDARLNIQEHQLPIIAEILAEDFKTESIEDISLALRRGGVGKYGQIFRLDVEVISGWMRKYLDEKYQEVENQRARLKKKTDSVEVAAGNIDMLTKFYEGWYKSSPNKPRDDGYAEYRAQQAKARKEQETPGAATINPQPNEVPQGDSE